MRKPYAASTRCCARLWMSVRAACLPRATSRSWAVAGSPPWRGHRTQYDWTGTKGTRSGGGGGPAAPAAGRRSQAVGRHRSLAGERPLSLIEPATLGDPERPLLWVSKSSEKLAAALRALGHQVSADTVGRLLRRLGFSRQGNFKANEGRNHPDRDAQFEHINAQVLAFQADDQPVISVDTKKKELVGNYRNPGTDWRRKGQPRRVNGHDFENKKLGKAIPYGVYDLTDDSGCVSVGVTHDTAQFAVNAIRTWLERMGRERYPT